MPRPTNFELDADEIVAAAVDIFQESGLEAVSMRSVASRLGVSPVPLYSRVGNKDALVDALAERLLADLAPSRGEAEAWTDYAVRWATELRARLGPAREGRLILGLDREAYVEASRPLIDAMRRGGLPGDAAVQACRLLMWATIGFVAVQGGAEPAGRPRRGGRPGGDPGGVEPAEVEDLFALHLRYLIDGIARDHADPQPADRHPAADPGAAP